jgi:GPH family glycoside/pentoside/hexuronide:cation symporter
VTFAFLVPTLLWIRETPHAASKEVPFGLIEASVVTMRNPAFLPYIIAGSLLGAAQVLVVQTIPYLVRVVVGRGDDVAGYILTGLVVLSAALIPMAERLARRFRKRDLFLVALSTFGVMLPITTLAGRLGIPALPHVIACCAILAPALAVALVIPRAILADIMDFDTERTGYRREAMYNGMEGLIQKIAMAIGFWAVGELFGAFGFSAEEPWGIIFSGVAGGVMALLGAVAFWFYPLRK